MAETALGNEFEYYLAHQAELAAKYQGRYIVIKGHRLLGDYTTVEEAVRSTTPAHEPGTFPRATLRRRPREHQGHFPFAGEICLTGRMSARSQPATKLCPGFCGLRKSGSAGFRR